MIKSEPIVSDIINSHDNNMNLANFRNILITESV